MTDAAEAPAAEQPVEESDEIVLSNWEFRGAPPTTEQVVKLLGSLRPVWGVKTVDYAEFVQALPQNQKVKEKNDKGQEITTYVAVWRLYMGVAGRVKMLEEAQEEHGWRVDFEPEPVTPTRVPGFVQLDERIVYREYVVIYGEAGNPIGRKPGTAWVPAKGGQQAAGSNPYEKVETSARGRAIAAWGFGVLPGTGIASLEEMQSVTQQPPDRIKEAEGQPRRPRGELLQEVLTRAEEVRQLRGQSDEEMKTKLAEYAKRAFGLDIGTEGFTADDGTQMTSALDWSKVKDGQLVLFSNQLADTAKKIRAAEAPV